MRKIRIMIFNAGYLTGITGGIFEYLFKFYRFIFPNLAIEKKISNSLVDVIKKVKPDILFLSEIHNNKPMASIKDLFIKHSIDVKYKPGSILNSIPFFKGNCNGVFLCDEFFISKFFIQNGTKKLVYEINVDNDLSIFFSHFSLGENTRKKQFLEFEHILRQKKQVIIAGDFNILKGVIELKGLLSGANLKVANNLNNKTFPSHNPIFAIDLFLMSLPIQIMQVQVLDDVVLSDHLPVVVDIELPI